MLTRIRPIPIVAALCLAVFSSVAGTAAAHQTASSNGATVTIHVEPDDEPEAGKSTKIKVVKVKTPKGGKFSFGKSRLLVTDSGGGTVLDKAGAKKTSITFPRSGAYRIQFSGKYKADKGSKKFVTSFSIRAR